MDEPSRLDRQIARDKLLADIEPLWEALHAALERTAAKLNGAYNCGISVDLNEHNSLIRADSSPTVKDRDTEVHRQLEIRLDRRARKVTVIVVETMRHIRAPERAPTRGAPFTFEIDVDMERGQLCFTQKLERFTPVALAEHLLTELLLGMKLPS